MDFTLKLAIPELGLKREFKESKYLFSPSKTSDQRVKFSLRLVVDNVVVEGETRLCLSVYICCEPANPTEDEWQCVASAEVSIGELTRKFNHKFTEKEFEWGFANFAPWDQEFFSEKNGFVDHCGTMNVSACIRALPPQFTVSASSSKSASVSGDKSEDEAYQVLIDAGQENHSLVKFTRLKDTKTNELEYLYNPNNPKNKHKNMCLQWNMAIKTLEGGKKDLHIAICKIKEEKPTPESQEKLLLKLELLMKDLEILLMKYTKIMKEHVPITNNPMWDAAEYSLKDLVLKTVVAKEKHVLPALHEFCLDKAKCTECPSSKNTVCASGKPPPPCVLNPTNFNTEGTFGRLVKMSFLKLLKHEDPEYRKQSISVFREIFMSPVAKNSDINEMKSMPSTEYWNIMIKLPYFPVVKYFYLNAALFLAWMTSWDQNIYIYVVDHFLGNTEKFFSAVKTVQESHLFGEHGLFGMFDLVVYLLVTCIKGDFCEFNLKLWMFELDILQHLANFGEKEDIFSKPTKHLFKFCENVWKARSWYDVDTSSVTDKSTSTKVKDCEVCRKPGEFSTNLLMRPRERWSYPVDKDDFNQFQRSRVGICSESCFLSAVSGMLPQLHFFTKNLGKEIIWDNNLSQELKAAILSNWNGIKYLTVRRGISVLMMIWNVWIEKGKVVRMIDSEDASIRHHFSKIQQTTENVGYVNKLLVHDEDFSCDHRLIWEGCIDMDGFDVLFQELLPSLKTGIGHKKSSLFICPSVDMVFSDKYHDVSLPWDTPEGKSADIIPLVVGSFPCKFLRENCWKLRFVGDLEVARNKLGFDTNCFLLVFTSDYSISGGVILIQNHLGRWVAFLPHSKDHFLQIFYSKDAVNWSNLYKNYAKEIAAMPVKKQRSLEANEVSCLIEQKIGILLTSLACEPSKVSRDMFPVVYRKSKPADKQKFLESHPQLFTSTHLVGCPHKLLWKGIVVQHNFTHRSLVRKFSFSGVGYECREACEPNFRDSAAAPPPSFWSSMPDELTVFQFDLEEFMLTANRIGVKHYMFVMDIGAFPDIFFPSGGIAFLFQDFKLVYTIVLRKPGKNRMLICDVLTGDPCSINKKSQFTNQMSLQWTNLKCHYKTNGLKGASGLFELITDNSFVVMSLPSHHIELPLCVRNQKRTVADSSLGPVLWQGGMIFMFLFPCEADSVTGLDQHSNFAFNFAGADQSSGFRARLYDRVFPISLGVYINSAYKTPSGHQVYGLNGYITGTLPSKDFRMFDVKHEGPHTFVALRVSKKLVENAIGRFKKCYFFNFHLHDFTFLNADFTRDICYFFGFFLPLGETVADKIKDEVELSSRFLILKYEERIDCLVGFYPKEQSKRIQLIQALNGKDDLSLRSHLRKLTAKPKKEETQFSQAAIDIDKILMKKNANGTVIKRSTVVEGDTISWKYSFEKPAEKDVSEEVSKNCKYVSPVTVPKVKLKRVKLAPEEFKKLTIQQVEMPNFDLKLADQQPSGAVAVNEGQDGVKAKDEDIEEHTNTDIIEKHPNGEVHGTQPKTEKEPLAKELERKAKDDDACGEKSKDKSTNRIDSSGDKAGDNEVLDDEKSSPVSNGRTVVMRTINLTDKSILENMAKKALEHEMNMSGGESEKENEKGSDGKKEEGKVEEKRKDRKAKNKKIVKSCWNCKKLKSETVKLYLCAGCEKARYCGQPCQLEHREEHKSFCDEHSKEKEETLKKTTACN